MRLDRIGVIGASQVAACLGLSHWQTPEQERQNILTGRWDTPPRKTTDPKYLGQKLEPACLGLLQDWLIEHGFGSEGQIEVVPWDLSVPEMERTNGRRPSLVHPDIPWLRATPDAPVRMGQMQALAQSKVPTRGQLGDTPERWGDADESRPMEDLDRWGIPRIYAVQMTVELGVARACDWPVEWNFAPVLGLPGRFFDVWPLEFSQAAFDGLLERLVPWYERHIRDGEPCPPATVQEAVSRHPRKPVARVDAETEQLLRRRVTTQDELKRLEAALERMDMQILAAVQGGAVIYGSSGRIGTMTGRRFRPDNKWR